MKPRVTHFTCQIFLLAGQQFLDFRGSRRGDPKKDFVVDADDLKARFEKLGVKKSKRDIKDSIGRLHKEQSNYPFRMELHYKESCKGYGFTSRGEAFYQALKDYAEPYMFSPESSGYWKALVVLSALHKQSLSVSDLALRTSLSEDSVRRGIAQLKKGVQVFDWQSNIKKIQVNIEQKRNLFSLPNSVRCSDDPAIDTLLDTDEEKAPDLQKILEDDPPVNTLLGTKETPDLQKILEPEGGNGDATGELDIEDLEKQLSERLGIPLHLVKESHKKAKEQTEAYIRSLKRELELTAKTLKENQEDTEEQQQIMLGHEQNIEICQNEIRALIAEKASLLDRQRKLGKRIKTLEGKSDNLKAKPMVHIETQLPPISC